MPEGQLLWTPSDPEASEMARFMRARGFADYHELWRWSVEDLDGFWGALWEWFDIDSPYERVLGSRAMPGAEWFPGAELSYAEQLFRGARPGETAIVHASESQPLAELSWDELADQVARCAAGLRRLGVERGDRVAAYMSNVPDTVVAFLACASIGAVWSSCAPEFGTPTVVDRFKQIEPRVLLATEGYRYGGKDFDRRERVGEIVAAIPSIEHTVLVPSGWDELLSEPAELSFERLPLDHPLWVLYSSGTTGLPKAIVQGQGGILLEHLKKLNLHVDAHPGDRLFWFTTTGWMMWNFLVSGLLTRAAIVLYDGNPGHPDMGTLWDLAEQAGVTMFGTSAAYIGACMKAGVEPGSGRDLSALKAIGSTGSPLSPEGFDWIYEHVGADTWLFSTSGGTDLCTAFVGGVATLPVYRGELQARALGAAVEAWNEDGEPVVEEVGELVVTEPMPSMPLYFWGDEDGNRYRESHFEMFPGTWRHGDWLELTRRGTAIIYGRSDSTINRGGIRMGTAEIYRAVLGIEEIVDALVVDVPRPGTDGWMPLFVVMREGAEVGEGLPKEIARRVREQCSPRHVPDEVFQIDEVPRTLSGKVLEVPVKKILTGTPVEKAASRDSLANPAALDYFVEMSKG